VQTPVRISNALPGTTVGVEYSTISPFSFKNKWLLLTHPGGFFGLYTGDGVFIRELPSVIDTSSRPRWDRRNPDQLTYLNGKELCRYCLAEDRHESIYRFAEYASIDDEGEADISLDNNHRVLCGTLPNGQQEVFVFELSTHTKGPVFAQAQPFDGLKITGANEPILSKASGIFVLGPHQRQLTTTNGHACVGRDANGGILLWTNSNENPVTLPSFPNGVVKMRTADGHQTGLISVPWTDAVDITMPESGDACFVSTYGGTEHSGKLYRVKLDGSANTLLLDGINHDVKNYDGQPKAAVSRDGSRIVWSATEPDGVTVNTWMLQLESLPIPTVLPELKVTGSPFPGFSRVPASAFGGKDYIVVFHADQTFEEYVED